MITHNDLDEFVIYDCRRSSEQKLMAQVIKIKSRILVKYKNGLFAVCNESELRLFAFKFIERKEDKKEIDDVDDVDTKMPGIYKFYVQGVLIYLIVFGDLSAVMVLENCFLFFPTVQELLAHITKSRLMCLA